MNKIAIPIWNNKLCQQFEECEEFNIYTLEKGNCIDSDCVKVCLQPGLFPFILALKGVTDIIANDIEFHSVSKLNKFKINVFVGVKSIDPEKLINEFMNGTLETFDILTNG